jgi:hypothetical protein
LWFYTPVPRSVYDRMISGTESIGKMLPDLKLNPNILGTKMDPVRFEDIENDA